MTDAIAPTMPGASRRHVVITGLMGVGKSTTAQAIGRALGYQVRDSDDDLERLFGHTGRQLVEQSGVEELHRLEAAVLLGALAATEPTVIAAAGSIVEDPRCREAMARRAFVVVLHAPIDELERRIRAGEHRRHMPRAEIAALAERRQPWLAEVADLRLDATATTDELRAAVLLALPGSISAEDTQGRQ